ncbi:MAG TPA: LLM class flavin-dependent oxidoreductase [Beijerinckiaceae bacterium]|nr:LLM class flavin-dependent oxidoreductase [Beijerinckiaceae bacterium]
MEFGVFDHLDTNSRPLRDYYEERLQLIELYDRAGFHAYHLAEHHGSPLGMAPSPNLFLASIAQRTKRLRFGPLVYALPLYHPLRLAEEIAMLDQLSGGRLELGFGRGSSPIEIAFFQQDSRDAEEDYVRILRMILEALETGTMRFTGAAEPHAEVRLTVSALQRPHPPIWYGVHSLASAERAARQRLNTVSLDGAEETRLCIARYVETWRHAHGAAPVARMGLGRFVVVAETDQAALAIARRAYLVWHDSFSFLARKFDRPAQHPRPADFDTLAAQGKGIAGRPETVAAALEKELVQSGANYFAGQFAFGDLTHAEAKRSVELFVKDVMPALAGLTPTPGP